MCRECRAVYTDIMMCRVCRTIYTDIMRLFMTTLGTTYYILHSNIEFTIMGIGLWLAYTCPIQYRAKYKKIYQKSKY